MTRFALLCLMVLCLAVNPSRASELPDPQIPVINRTLRLPATPPVIGFASERAFGSLNFLAPLAISSPIGETNRLFVLEKAGRVVVLTNLANPTRTVFLDISGRVHSEGEQGLLGMAFHPGYATNGFFFLFYTANAAGTPDRLSRFAASRDNPDLGHAESETILLEQFDEAPNQNGGDLHFGPDGYLYVAVGDEGGREDEFSNSQRIDGDFFSGILRLDVDKRPGNLEPNPHPSIIRGVDGRPHYAVPADNPFVGAQSFNGQPLLEPSKIRTEFWAVGLRNPWRFSFDELTGRLYCGDAGQESSEEIDLIVAGGNFGWGYLEGRNPRPGSASPPPGFVGMDPLYEYSREQGSAIIGGVVYRGARFARLNGAYTFADYGSGRIWALRMDETMSPVVEQLTTDEGIVSFGIDPRNGDVLLCDLTENTVKRLVDHAASPMPAIPSTLAETGAFSDLSRMQPEPGVVPYQINVPFWSDNASKSRWFSIASSNQLFGFRRDANWLFPAGTIWIKHFELELTNGVPGSRRRLETRFLVRNLDGVYGVTYRWGDSLTNATLVPETGLDESFAIHESGTVRTQVWHYPSRTECNSCHGATAGWALGFNTAQLNLEIDSGRGRENQISLLARAGYLDQVVSGVPALPALASATNTSFSLEYRVRSFFAANCAQCHQPGGAGQGYWDARISTPLAQAGIINGPLQWNDRRQDPANRVVTPGDLGHSRLFQRLANFGHDHMPPLDSTVLNVDAIALLKEWIQTDLTNYTSFADWQFIWFGSNQIAAAAPSADPDGDGASNELEYVTQTNPLLLSDCWKPTVTWLGDSVRLEFLRMTNRGFEVQWTTNLLDPGSWRPLDAPENRFSIPAVTQSAVLRDLLLDAPAKYYRVRVTAP